MHIAESLCMFVCICQSLEVRFSACGIVLR